MEFFVKVDGGYHKCFIFKNGRRNNVFKGCGGTEMIITMSNGWKIVTNDLWYEDITYLDLPINALTGIVEVNVNDEPVDETYIY